MDKKYKNWKEFFFDRSGQIYILRYSKEIRKAEKEKINIQNNFCEFLKEKLSNEDYKKAFSYMNNIFEKNNLITDLWNEKFYFSALKDAKKYEGVIDE